AAPRPRPLVARLGDPTTVITLRDLLARLAHLEKHLLHTVLTEALIDPTDERRPAVTQLALPERPLLLGLVLEIDRAGLKVDAPAADVSGRCVLEPHAAPRAV